MQRGRHLKSHLSILKNSLFDIFQIAKDCGSYKRVKERWFLKNESYQTKKDREIT